MFFSLSKGAPGDVFLSCYTFWTNINFLLYVGRKLVHNKINKLVRFHMFEIIRSLCVSLFSVCWFEGGFQVRCYLTANELLETIHIVDTNILFAFFTSTARILYFRRAIEFSGNIYSRKFLISR